MTGVVLDAKTGDPIIGSNVILKNTFLGTAADESGHFSITQIPFGEYVIKVSAIGYAPFEEPVLLSARTPSAQLSFMLIQDVLESAQVVVTASRNEQDILDLPVSVSVVSSRKLMEKNTVTLDEILIYESGVTIVKDQLNIRGASGYTLGAGSRSLLLLDGIPLMGSASGNISWNVIPASEIDRVEIVKSGASSMYGSGAMGGVVNIITRNSPKHKETKVRLIGGMYSQPSHAQWEWRDSPSLNHTVEITHALPVGSHSGWFRLQKYHSDGYTELGWNDHWNATGKMKLNFGGKYSASVFGNIISYISGLESQWKGPADPFEAVMGAEKDRADGQKVNVNTTFSIAASPSTVLHVKGSHYDVRWENNGTNKDKSHEQKWYGEIQGGTRLGSTWHVTAGLGSDQSSIDASIFGTHHIQTPFIYGLLRGKIGNGLSISIGGRGEQFIVDGGLNNNQAAPQIAMNYHPFQWLSFRASAAQSFRSPTVAEMFSRSQLSVFRVEPNPDLSPETSHSTEIGMTMKGAHIHPAVDLFQFDISIFRSSYSQMIEPTPDHKGVIHFENITNAVISGIDAGLGTRLFHGLLDIQTSYTFLSPYEVDHHGNVIDTLSYRYRHHLTQTTRINLGLMAFLVDSRHTNRMESTELFSENAKTGKDKRVPINVWNVGVSYDYRDYEIRFRVENIFQQYYVELERNMGEVRNYHVSLYRNF